jgi:hypothetical protein
MPVSTEVFRTSPLFFLLENEIFDGRGNSTQTGRSIIITGKLLAAQKALHCYNKKMIRAN